MPPCFTAGAAGAAGGAAAEGAARARQQLALRGWQMGGGWRWAASADCVCLACCCGCTATHPSRSLPRLCRRCHHSHMPCSHTGSPAVVSCSATVVGVGGAREWSHAGGVKWVLARKRKSVQACSGDASSLACGNRHPPSSHQREMSGYCCFYSSSHGKLWFANMHGMGDQLLTEFDVNFSTSSHVIIN